MRSLLQLSLPAILLTGCAVGPDYTPPELETPDAWQAELAEEFTAGETGLSTWWTEFGDPQLESLIQRAAQGNLNLEIAVSRIREAQALRGIVASERLPTVTADGVASRNRLSEGTNPVLQPGTDRTGGYYDIGGGATWEIDFWGRITRSIESADAGIQASVENYRDVLVLLHAEIAATYLQYRTVQARLDFARKNVEAQTDAVGLTNDRFKAGISGELDLRQAELNLASTESIVPQLETALVETLNRLAVLLGEFPGALREELATTVPIPSPPETIALGLPADILRRRPDVRRAERELAAQTARIGVATADLYPRFTLFGNLHLEATSSGDLLDSGSRSWGFGPSFSWDIFSGGRIRANIEVEDARTEQALLSYEQAVLLAVEEVEDAMVSYVQEKHRHEILTRAVDASQRSVELVEVQYKTGVTNFQNVLDMHRSLFQQQDNLAESEGLVVQDLVRLYRALGGGWEPEPAPETAETP
jgi:outer membrane protein, multidrug efflux system